MLWRWLFYKIHLLVDVLYSLFFDVELFFICYFKRLVAAKDCSGTFILKAKLEAVSSGLVTFEEEFLANIAGKLPSGVEVTVGDLLIPKLSGLFPSCKQVFTDRAENIDL